MSGHSKWSSIKHKKSKEDAKRGKIFTRLINEITIAARIGGGDPSGNPRLRSAIQAAKDNNMPADNMKRAIKKGTGELPGMTFDEVSYEGYGPGGVAVLIETLTDNRNRTVAEIRYILSKAGGNLGETNCVSWLFKSKGMLIFDLEERDEDELLEIAMENEAEDFNIESGTVEIFTEVDNFEIVKEKFEELNIEFSVSEVTKIPQTSVKLEGKKAKQMLRLMEKLEDHDDVNDVYANFDIDIDIMENL